MQDTDALGAAQLAGDTAQALSDWQRMHRTLLEAEKELARTSRLYARGDASVSELDAASARVVALRELSLAVLARLRRSAG
jgi:hypothetical protein